MRIVFLNITAALGGAERALLDMLASLREADPALDLHLILAADGPLSSRVRQLGVTVHFAPIPRSLELLGDSSLRSTGRVRAAARLALSSGPAAWAAYRYARQLRRLLDDLLPDLIHSNSIKFHLLSRFAGLAKVPLVWHVHDFLGARPLMAKVLRWASGPLRGAVAISQSVAEDARTVLPGVPIRVVYNAVDTDDFSPGPGDGPRLDALAGLPNDPSPKLRVGLIATYARWKGQETFLRAAAHFLKESGISSARFYIVGGPIYQTQGSQWSQTELEKLAQMLGIRSAVAFVPFQQDVAQVYRALDVVVHASSQPEPFGRTIVEAMACGKPVVISNAGGAAELFTDGQDALGFPPQDSERLAETVRSLLVDPQKRERLGNAGRATALARFARRRYGPELLAFYRDILA